MTRQRFRARPFFRGAMMADERSGVEPVAQTEANRWAKDYEDFRHTRMARVQAAAQQWLSTITALLGLFGAATVAAGGTTLTVLPLAERCVIVVGAVVVYVLAAVAVWYGARASFGGLGLKPYESDPNPRTGREILNRWWTPMPLTGGLNDYIKSYEQRTNKLRERLHRSRMFGIAAAGMSGVVGCIVLGFALFASKR